MEARGPKRIGGLLGVIVLFVLSLAISLKVFTRTACPWTPAIAGRL